jgi:hypothetical protein
MPPPYSTAWPSHEGDEADGRPRTAARAVTPDRWADALVPHLVAGLAGWRPRGVATAAGNKLLLLGSQRS